MGCIEAVGPNGAASERRVLIVRPPAASEHAAGIDPASRDSSAAAPLAFTGRNKVPKLDEAGIATFLRPFNEKGGDILLALGITPVEMGEGRAVLKMPFGPNTSQLTGLFATGALISLADITATAACYNENEEGTFPLCVQLSANLVGNTNTGTATAEARVVHSGRNMKVAETIIRDDNNRILARVTTTHLITPVTRKS
jgi:1,4-dihydroxy-2-naphthoyl-CoA hydrolase